MRFHVARLLTMWAPNHRQHMSQLAASNRNLVRLFLYLVAFAGSWQFSVWVLTTTAMTSPYDAGSWPESNGTSPDLWLPANETLPSTVRHPLPVNVTGPLKASTASQPANTVKNVNVTSPDVDVEMTTIVRPLNLSRLHLIHQSERCRGDRMASVVVHSAPGHFERRAAIRQTWGSKMAPTFFLGVSQDPAVSRQIDAEVALYGDIIQASFIDSYANLTYKHVVALAWSRRYCSSRYIVKVDDDVYLRVPQMLDHLQQMSDPNKSKEEDDDDDEDANKVKDDKEDEDNGNDDDQFIGCDLQRNADVKRSFRSKWRLSFRDYSQYKYPDYCSGWIILYPRSILTALLNRIPTVPYLWVDDVYVTGLLAKAAHVPRRPIDDELLLRDWADLGDPATAKGRQKLSRVAYGPPQLQVDQLRQLWHSDESIESKPSL